MSRYVTKKHGLIIGSDNIFFYKEDGKLRQFKSLVRLKEYDFDNINFANVLVRTPAQQICLKEVPAADEDALRHNDEWSETVFIPSAYVTRWLNENTPGWGFPQRCIRNDANFFFKSRTHALAFCKFVDETLRGMRFSD